MSAETMIPFVAVFAATAILFFVGWFFIARLLSGRREMLERRMAGREDELPIVREDYVPTRRGAAPEGIDLSFQRMVERTGLDLQPGVALATIVLFGTILAAFVFVWRFEEEPWLAIPAFFLGSAIPLAFLLWRQRAWRRTLQQQLPDAMFLLARSLRAGRSVEQAFQLVGDQGVPPISREFSRMVRQMELGLSLGQVLQITTERLGLVDFNVFASVLTLHRTTGGNLPLLLDRLAVSTRDRNQFEGQYRAATVLGRYSAGFIAAMVSIILVYLFFFQREWALRFFDTTYSYTGIFLFTTAIGLELLGALLLFWLLRYDY